MRNVGLHLAKLRGEEICPSVVTTTRENGGPQGTGVGLAVPSQQENLRSGQPAQDGWRCKTQSAPAGAVQRPLVLFMVVTSVELRRLNRLLGYV